MPINHPHAGWYHWEGEDLWLRLRVQPGAARNEWAEVLEGVRKVRIAAPPVDGHANARLCRWLAKHFRVPLAQVEVVSGSRGRQKQVRIRAPRLFPEPLMPPETEGSARTRRVRH